MVCWDGVLVLKNYVLLLMLIYLVIRLQLLYLIILLLKNKEKMHEVTWKGGIVMMNLLEDLMGLLWKGAKYLLVAIVVFYVLLLITAW